MTKKLYGEWLGYEKKIDRRFYWNAVFMAFIAVCVSILEQKISLALIVFFTGFTMSCVVWCSEIYIKTKCMEEFIKEEFI
jgi:hypothetical protein